MLVSGNMVSQRVLESRFGVMEIDMRGISKIV